MTPTGQAVVYKVAGITKWSPIEMKRGVDSFGDLWKWRETLIQQGQAAARVNGIISQRTQPCLPLTIARAAASRRITSSMAPMLPQKTIAEAAVRASASPPGAIPSTTVRSRSRCESRVRKDPASTAKPATKLNTQSVWDVRIERGVGGATTMGAGEEWDRPGRGGGAGGLEGRDGVGRAGPGDAAGSPDGSAGRVVRSCCSPSGS